MKPEEAVAIVRICADDAKEDPTVYRVINGEEVLCAVTPLDATTALLEGFEAAVVPESVIDAVEEVKHAVAYNGHAELSRACSGLWRVWDNWRGPEPGGEGEGWKGGKGCEREGDRGSGVRGRPGTTTSREARWLRSATRSLSVS